MLYTRNSGRMVAFNDTKCFKRETIMVLASFIGSVFVEKCIGAGFAFTVVLICFVADTI